MLVEPVENVADEDGQFRFATGEAAAEDALVLQDFDQTVERAGYDDSGFQEGFAFLLCEIATIVVIVFDPVDVQGSLRCVLE